MKKIPFKLRKGWHITNCIAGKRRKEKLEPDEIGGWYDDFIKIGSQMCMYCEYNESLRFRDCDIYKEIYCSWRDPLEEAV